MASALKSLEGNLRNGSKPAPKGGVISARERRKHGQCARAFDHAFHTMADSARRGACRVREGIRVAIGAWVALKAAARECCQWR